MFAFGCTRVRKFHTQCSLFFILLYEIHLVCQTYLHRVVSIYSDGTTNFVHGLALTCVLISFLQDKQPMVGVIYDPLAEEMFWAVLGRGAYRTCFRQRGTKNSSTTKLSVSRTTELPQAVVAIDAGYGRSTESVDKFLAIQRAILLKRVRNIRIFGCCG